MNSKTSLPGTPSLLDIDLQRTERPVQHGELFYWDDDTLIHTGQINYNMTNALSQLSFSLKSSFKQHLISFSKQGYYAPNSYTTFFSTLKTAMKVPPCAFDANWMAKALSIPSFRRYKIGIALFFQHWKERDNTAIGQDVLRLLIDAAPPSQGPRGVLSDDPERSWLTDEEYEDLLKTVWTNYDSGDSGTQVTLIKLLSMQYARRPVQIAHLKIGDIRESDGTDNNLGVTGRIIDFPGTKDQTAETDFRDSKFEVHPLADHLWDLFHVQRHEISTLYEHSLGFSLTDEQLNKLPLFCSEERILTAISIIQDHEKLYLFENLDSRHFHLKQSTIGKIIRWVANTPTCNYGADKSKWDLRPKPPISPRTGQEMAINATRMRHTRARQLARRGVLKHLLSHWLGHTKEKSLEAYYNDPAEQARQLDEAMAPLLAPIAMAFAGTLIDSEYQATRASDPTSKLEFSRAGQLKSVGRCGKHSFCATTSVPIPCYRCKYFEPLVNAPHEEVLEALLQRQVAEEQVLKIGGPRNLLIPIDLSSDILAVQNCIARCNVRKAEQGMSP